MSAQLAQQLKLVHRGKVRDTFELGEHLLMVATDRISAFDYVLPTMIPDKGRVLSSLSAYWFRRLGHIVPNHLVSDGRDGLPVSLRALGEEIAGRAMVVRRAERIPFECVARGYLAGSGWAEYRQYGMLAGEPLEPGLRESERLEEPRFTPAVKNDDGHDQNISLAILQTQIGTDLAQRLRDLTLRLYATASEHAAGQGILIADTKFEFGLIEGELTLIDEALTPDSSRFWLADSYEPGRPQASLDKQYVRDWLLQSGWDRESTPPELPPEVVEATRDRYLEAYRRLTGEELAV